MKISGTLSKVIQAKKELAEEKELLAIEKKVILERENILNAKITDLITRIEELEDINSTTEETIG